MTTFLVALVVTSLTGLVKKAVDKYGMELTRHAVLIGVFLMCFLYVLFSSFGIPVQEFIGKVSILMAEAVAIYQIIWKAVLKPIFTDLKMIKKDNKK